MKEKILIVDDEVDICQLLCKFLEKKGYSADYSITGKKGLKQLKKENYDLVLLDFRLPDMDGTEALKAIKNQNPSTQVIIITGYSDVKTAVDCIKLGASEYVTKPIHPEEILHSVKSSLANKEEKKATNNSKKTTNSSKPKQSKTFIEGKSSQSQKVQQLIKLLAPTNMSVIIEGESGTGKEMVANAIHLKSERSNKPFVAIDCGALPKELAASELFGHIKGSFTGAINDKVGHFEAAKGGTLFLDEIGNLTYDNQVKLLRVLQERKIKKIGDTKPIDIDVRIIVASNESLEEKVKKGDFREDLYYRLNEFMVELPPLRQRGDDILTFADYFLQNSNQELQRNFKGFNAEAKQIISNYSWPGNLREMKNVIKRAALLGEGNRIKAQDFPLEIRNPKAMENGYDDSEPITDLKSVAERAERRAILKVLEQTNYNKTQAAKVLKVDRKTLYNKMEAYEIEFKRAYE
ncbi:MAG: sigma-54-dependent Fis family transcriptional regulator [Flavobacteriales bacterium]|nr:sigma-54-dependent Fis family transcriptional regulator [Flavobacteriales bacterium]|tara:strand:+ start:4997 stop:6388 length:1392 start_codon:yes stop_codon:yes gene_type:complete